MTLLGLRRRSVNKIPLGITEEKGGKRHGK
jgi:hypothetical protein